MYRIGIDLGGTNIAAGLVNEKFEIVAKDSLPTLSQRPAEEIVADIAKVAKMVCDEAGIAPEEVTSLGIASPGIVDDEKGTVVYSCNLRFYNFPILEKLRELLPIKEMHIENDANAAAWAEAIAGAAQGSKNSVMITLGTGVGGGIVIDGKIFKGFNSAAAELGHMVIEAGGRQCNCGRKGCFETYSSATGLINMTKEKLAECKVSGRKTLMTELAEKAGKVNGCIAFNAKRMGDEAANEVVAEYSRYLAIGIANLINIFQPEVFSIGGGISGEGDYLLEQILSEVHAQQYGTGLVPDTDIRIAKLRNDAGIIGAAVLGM